MLQFYTEPRQHCLDFPSSHSCQVWHWKILSSDGLTIKFYVLITVTILLLSWAPQLLQMSNTSEFLCNKVAVLKDTIKGNSL